MTTISIPKTVCPFCAVLQTAYTTVDDVETQPQNGSICLCIDCGEWCQYEDGVLTIPSDDTYDRIAKEPECRAARQVWLRLKDSDGGEP